MRNYGAGVAELGAEPTMEAYLDNTMLWVKEVWRVLKPTGSFVLNIGDSFVASGGRKGTIETGVCSSNRNTPPATNFKYHGFYKPKQLLSVSSFAYCRIVSETDFVCRGEHIWAKPNVPSPIRSRLKHSHEKLFWFVKDADRYYFDSKAWMKKKANTSNLNIHTTQAVDSPHSDNIKLSKTSVYRAGHGDDHFKKSFDTIEHSWRIVPVGAKAHKLGEPEKTPSLHIAPYPEKLVAPYIQSLCPQDGVILDPFLGSGTTMYIAATMRKSCIGIELNGTYAEACKKRLNWGHELDTEYEVK